MDKKQELKVYYDSDEVNTKLDEAIEKAVKPFGYNIWASGYSIIDRTRDLAFYKVDR